MEDIARIGFRAETGELVNAKKKLEDIEPAAKGAETATQRLERAMDRLNTGGSTLGRTFGLLKNFLGGFAAALSVRQYVQLADSWSDISARVGLAVGDMDKAAATMDRLADIADRTYSSLTNTAEGFVSQSTALRELGYSTSQSLDYIESLNSALVVSGARGDRAAMLMNNLSKAMAGGALRGNELNTILESGGRITELIAAEMGVTTTQLRKLGAEGKITGGIIYNALVGNLELLREEAEKMPATVEDGFIKIGNAVLQMVGKFDTATGTSAAIAAALLFVAENVQQITIYALAGAAVIGATYIPTLIAMTRAAVAATVAMVNLRRALMLTGVGIAIVLIGALANLMVDLIQKTGSVGAAFTELGLLAGDVWRGIGESAKAIPPALAGVWALARSEFSRFVADLSYMWADFLTFFKTGLEAFGANDLAESLALGPITSAIRLGNQAMDDSANASAEASAKFAEAGKAVSDAFQPARDRLAALNKVIDDAGEAADGASPNIAGLGNETEKAGGKAKKAAEELTALQKLAEEFDKLAEPFKQAESAFKSLEFAKDKGIISNDAFAASLGRIEKAFIASGGSAEQWALIINGATDSIAKKLRDLGERSMEDLGRSFADLAVDGKANFADLTKSIIKDLLAIAWQAMVVKPLLSFMGIPLEKGGVVDQSGMTPFAKGGTFTDSIVNSPTPFKFAQGGGFGLGVMGEAGPEAVMPLTRGPDGSLGVQMYGGKGSGRDRQQSGGNGEVVEVRITTEASPMFVQYVEEVSQDNAVKVTHQAMDQMNDQLPARIAEIQQDSSRVR